MASLRTFLIKLRILLDALTKISFALSLVAVGCLIIMMTIEVFSRYIFRASTAWSFELSTMAFGAIFVLGIGPTLYHNQHIRVDLIYARLSEQKRNLIDGAGYVFFLIPCVFLINQDLWIKVWETFHSGETTGYSAWNPVVWPFALLIAAGFSVFFIQLLAKLLHSIIPQDDGIKIAEHEVTK